MFLTWTKIRRYAEIQRQEIIQINLWSWGDKTSKNTIIGTKHKK